MIAKRLKSASASPSSRKVKSIEGIEYIPESWEVVEIGELGDCVMGSTPKTKIRAYYEPPIEDFIAPADLGNSRYIYNSEKKISPEGMKVIRRLPRDAVMCVCIGSSIGKVGMTFKDVSATNQQINSIICGEGRDPSFTYFLLNYHSEYWKSFSTFGPVPILSKGRFTSINVPLPPLAEQKKIAHILSTAQRAMEAQERIIRTTTELKKALMQELFTEGLRNEPQKQTEIGPIPQSWEVVELEQKAESFQYGTSVKCGYETDGKSVLRIPNVVGGHVDTSDLKFGNPKNSELGKLTLKAGDLLFVRTNGVKANAGRCSIFNDELEDCYYASYLIRVRLDPKTLNPVFLSEYSRTEVGTSFLSGRSIRTADGKFNINSGTLKTMLVPVPLIEEQEEIAKSLALVDRKAMNTKAKKANLQDLFRTLLHELMTAKIRVHKLELPKWQAKGQ